MANDTVGSSALKNSTLSESENIVISGSKAKIVNLDDYRNPVEKKIAEISQVTASSLKGDAALVNELKNEIRSIINKENVKTSREEINDLAEIISKKLGIENNSEVKIEAKRVRLEIDKWKEKNIKEVSDFRKEEFKDKFEKETKKLNPNLKEEELINIKKYGELIADIYSDESVIEKQKDSALEANSQLYSPGKLENAWIDLEGLTNFLKKTPEQIRDIKEKYNSVKDGLKNVNLPNNLKEVRSFEKVISSFSNGEASGLFGKTQKYLGWIDKADKLTGGWINKTIIQAGQNFVSKIGNQAVQEFATNSLNIMAKEGFQKGFTTVLNGILKGGVKAAGSTAATGVAAGGAAAGATAATAATGVGIPVAVIMAAIQVALFVKKQLSKIAEKLGISTKKFFEENFGKVGGKIMNGIVSLVALPALLIGAVSTVVVGPILIVVFGGLFLYQMFQGNLVSSLVPPRGSIYNEAPDTDSNTFTIGDINVPLVPVNFTRQDLIGVAMSLKGNIPYFWGGTYNAIGANPEWGQLREVTSEGSKKHPVGRWEPYGLDCSGFVNWVYYQLTKTVIAGNSYDMIKKADNGEWQFVDKNNLKPGDIAWRIGHVAIYLNEDASGNKIFIEAYNGINLRSNTTEVDGNKKMSFTEYIRPNVNFYDD